MHRLFAFAVVVALGACSHGKATGPAWPAPDKPDPDDRDGESIAPHEASTVATALEKSDESAAKKDDEPDEAVPAAATEDKPATPAPSTQPSTDDVIMSDEIIIEIDD